MTLAPLTPKELSALWNAAAPRLLAAAFRISGSKDEAAHLLAHAADDLEAVSDAEVRSELEAAGFDVKAELRRAQARFKR
jgi:hypothetical protein